MTALIDDPTWKKTACILCECNCGIEVQTEGRTLAKIRGDREHVETAGYTCNKALRLDRYQNGRDRITSPLRRRPDGTFEEIDWDTAVNEVAERLAKVRDTHGGDKILYYGGGGQGNHLGGAYSGATLKALGARVRSSALAQEKTGEGWVDTRLYGGHTRGDFEHAEVALFVGKNPWQSQSFPRARQTLRDMAKDPQRAIIVLDPVVTDTAKMADHHLRVKPGGDAWALAAIAATIVQEHLHDAAWLAEHTTGAHEAVEQLRAVDIAACATASGVPEEQLRTAARRIAAADSVSVFEDLGVQQGPNSVLCSYLNKLIWIVTGNFAGPGKMHLHSWMQPLARYDMRERYSPVTKTLLAGGMLPCNLIADEILTDHPDRFRAFIAESGNPAHSTADSKRFREAMEACDVVVVIDIAMTETARCADYVLPAASQFEKYEATFFNLEFPKNTFHLRAPLFDPEPGTLPEPEIHARIVRALNVFEDGDLDLLKSAAHEGRAQFAAAFGEAAGRDPRIMQLAPFVLYEALGPTLGEAASAAVLWAVAHRCAMTYPDAVRRAGHEDGEALFDAILASRSGVTFTLDDYDDAWSYITHPDKRIAMSIPELFDEIESLSTTAPGWTTDEFPLVLSAGERRAWTANTIFRDPTWRKQDAGGALRVSPEDAQRLGLTDGGRARVTTRRGSADTVVAVSDVMQPGHISIPNGMGLNGTPGIAPNELTASDWRDPMIGTPWHKHVPARVEALVSP